MSVSRAFTALSSRMRISRVATRPAAKRCRSNSTCCCSRLAKREQQQVEFERQRFAAGRVATREILMREERAVNARLTLIEQQATYARARVVFESAQGTLLQRWSR